MPKEHTDLLSLYTRISIHTRSHMVGHLTPRHCHLSTMCSPESHLPLAALLHGRDGGSPPVTEDAMASRQGAFTASPEHELPALQATASEVLGQILLVYS